MTAATCAATRSSRPRLPRGFVLRSSSAWHAARACSSGGAIAASSSASRSSSRSVRPATTKNDSSALRPRSRSRARARRGTRGRAASPARCRARPRSTPRSCGRSAVWQEATASVASASTSAAPRRGCWRPRARGSRRRRTLVRRRGDRIGQRARLLDRRPAGGPLGCGAARSARPSPRRRPRRSR